MRNDDDAPWLRWARVHGVDSGGGGCHYAPVGGASSISISPRDPHTLDVCLCNVYYFFNPLSRALRASSNKQNNPARRQKSLSLSHVAVCFFMFPNWWLLCSVVCEIIARLFIGLWCVIVKLWKWGVRAKQGVWSSAARADRWVVLTQCTHVEFVPVIFGYFDCELGWKLHFTAHVRLLLNSTHKAGWTNFDEFVHMAAFSVSRVSMENCRALFFRLWEIKTCFERLHQLPIFSSSSEKRAAVAMIAQCRIREVSELVARATSNHASRLQLKIASKTMGPQRSPTRAWKMTNRWVAPLCSRRRASASNSCL